MIALLPLAGCLSFSGDPGHKGDPALSVPYSSRIDSPESVAFYYFAEASLMLSNGDFEGAEGELLKAIVADPQSAELRLTLSKLYVRMRETEKAIRAAEDALIQAPDNADAHFHLAAICFSEERDAEAVEHYKRVIELDPERENAYIHLAISSARLGDMERAVATLKTLLERRPDSLAGELALARLYRELELSTLAEDSYLRVLQKHSSFDSAYFELADLYESSGEISKALDIYRSGLGNSRQSAFYHQQIVRLLILLERYDEAVLELSVILSEDPDNLEAMRRLGLIRLQQGDWAAAGEIFGDLHVRLPDSDNVRFYYGTALEEMDDFERALRVFREISPESDLYPDTLSHLAYLYHQLKRPEEAIVLLTQRVDDLSNPPEFFSYLTSLHLTRDEYNEAHAVIDKGLLLHENNPELIYRKALVYEQQGDRAQALVTMRKLLDLDPENAEALNYIAYIYAEEETNLDEALEMALKAIALKDEGHVLDTLGWVYFKLGRYEEARHAMEKAVAFLSEDPLVLEHLGDVYRAMGLSGLARMTYEQAKTLASDKTAIQEKIEQLSE